MRPLTRSCFLLLVQGKLSLHVLSFLLEIYLPSPWSPPSPLHAPALILLSLAKGRISPIFTLSPLMIWCFGQTALFLFPFGKDGFGLLANCSLCGTEATLSFSAGPVCSSFSAEACAILHALAGLGSTNKFSISLLFSYYVTLVLSSPPCPILHIFSYLKLCGRSGRNCLLSPPVLSDYNGSPDIRFSRETTR